MKRTNLSFTIDILSFIGFIFLTTTGILMYYVLPTGSGHSLTIWGLDRHQWGAIHFWIAVVFFSILTIHLILHWHLISSIVRGDSKENSRYRAAIGIVSLFALIAISISPLLSPIQVDNKSTKQYNSEKIYSSNEFKLKGSLTLRDIEIKTGVPASYIIEALKLPSDTPVNKNLGLLKKEYNFDIKNISKIISMYPEE